ncbi:MAG: CsbD family protein [Thermomicrobiales bacterium]
MVDQMRDRTEGKTDEIKGRGKQAWGDVTGDEETKSEGEMDEATGKFKQGMADAKDKLDDAKDKIKDLTDR